MIDVEQLLMSLRRHKDADGKLNPIYLADTLQEEIEIIKEAAKHSQRWVGLTEDEIALIVGECAASHRHDDVTFAKEIETKLREKNGG
jgi:hypothetical protein